MKMNKKTSSLHEKVAADLIERLEKGTAPWQKPWNSEGGSVGLPYNAITGNRYKGINIFSLMNADRDDPRWMTFKQASSNGWQIKKGEKATLVQYVKTHELIPKLDEHGKQLLDENGKKLKIKSPLDRAMITTAWVFNAEQVSGILPLDKKNSINSEWNPVHRAEELIVSSGADVKHRKGDEAYYSLRSDSITMPLKEQFSSPDCYYATLLHELGHWTGHKDRLDRSLINRFGTENYAREELRAEIASMLMGEEFNIGHDPGQHAAYVQGWIKILKDNPFEIHAAATDAEKIFNYLLNFERKLDLKESVTHENDKKKDTRLFMGDLIDYNNSTYKVSGVLKRGRFQVEDQNKGKVFVLSSKDNLYGSLLDAKNGRSKPIRQETDSVQEVQKASYGFKR
ncbi:conserved hypothetical protein [Sphingobacterium sp. PM2-P1-29]|nr:conserved hypothetical protein [Sphingobacterium sp. PM2-P1-29]